MKINIQNQKAKRSCFQVPKFNHHIFQVAKYEHESSDASRP